MGSIYLVDQADSSSLSDVRVRDAPHGRARRARAAARRGLRRLPGSPAPDAWERYIGEIVDIRGRLGESELIVAEDAGRLVGTIGFSPDAARSTIERWSAGWASIPMLGGRAEARRRGVGTAPARECVRRAQARGSKAIGLHTVRPSESWQAQAYRLDLEEA